jgi:hypothetical protein
LQQYHLWCKHSLHVFQTGDYYYLQKRTMKFTSLSLSTFALVLSGAAAADCPYLPVDQAPTIEFSLPSDLYQDFSKTLPSLSFEGLKPLVTRKTVPYGTPPLIKIERYSNEPTIEYDREGNKVVIKSEQCSVGSAAPSSRLPWVGLALSAAMGLSDSTRSVALPATFLTLWGASLLPGAKAQDDCSPAVHVVIEAPAGTMDAVEQCYAEVKNPELVCPEPFPTFPTCSDATPTCKVVAVGAAAGGLYSAMR